MMNNDGLASAPTRVLGAEEASTAGGKLAAGTRIGAYRIVRLLGAGGMGEVYLAEQLQPVQRQVALKLLPDEIASPMARAWFEVERQALAQMQHPAIARIFDAGTSEHGLAWIAMEWIEGQPLTTYCETRHLSREDRLRLFQRVCHGVQHAHQKGVIHRDLKPDNVLVRELDGKPQPTLIDFGIAIGQAGGGEHGHAGTLAYMSPEQAGISNRDIDTRSDVYSLGVMLFEILVGDDATRLTTKLFQSAGQRARQTLLDKEGRPLAWDERAPALMLRNARDVPDELQAIMRKALALDRDDRYESASALAEDLDRYLTRRPLAAVPASKGYLLRKFVSRHRYALLASGLVFVAVVAGFAMALEGRYRATKAAQEAQQQATRAERVSAFVSEILVGVDPDQAKGMDTALMRMVLDNAAKKAVDELADAPEVRASIENTIAGSYGSLGMYEKAIEHNTNALQAARQAGLPDLVMAQILVSKTLHRVILRGGNEEVQAEVQAIQGWISGLPARQPERLRVELDLGQIEWQTGKLEDAMARMQIVVPAMREVLDADSVYLNHAESLLATLYSEMGEYAKAERLQRELLKRSLRLHGENNSDSVASASELAISLNRQDRFAEAEKLLRHYLPISQQRLGAEDPRTMAMFSNLGAAIRQQGRNEEARPYYEKMLAWSTEKYGEDNYRTIVAHANMAFLLRDIDQLAQAEEQAQIAVDHMDTALGAGNGMRGQLVDVLGTIQFAAGDYAAAAESYDRAWQIYLAASGFGADHPLAQQTARHQVELYKAWQQPDQVALWQQRLQDESQTDG